MDGLVGAVTHAYHVIRVQQCICVPQHVLFGQRVQVVDDDLRPDQLAIPYHPVRDLVLRMCQIAAHVPHNDLVPELPPFSRLVKILIQVPVKPKGVVPHCAVQLQVMEAVVECCVLTKLRVCLSAHTLSTQRTSRPWQMSYKSSTDRSAYHAGLYDLLFHHGKHIKM